MLASRAFLELAWGVCLLSAIAGCRPERLVKPEPVLIALPGRAYQGTAPIVELTVAGEDFFSCAHIVDENGILLPLAPQAFSFVPPGSLSSDASPSVSRVEVLAAERMRVRMDIPSTVTPGLWTLGFRCSGDDGFAGRFRVDAVSPGLTLTVSPSSVAAGLEYQKVDIALTDEGGLARFEDGVTRLVFGGGSDVVVLDEVVAPDGRTLSAWLNISALALAPEEDSKTIDVIATTGPQVATGSFEITATHDPSISLSPGSAVRPANGQDSIFMTIAVTATNFEFPFAVADTEGTPPTVHIAGNPGIFVSDVQMQSVSQLQFVLEVSSFAAFGPSAVTVTSGDVELTGTFRVVPTPGDVSIRFFPHILERCASDECAPRLVIAQGIGLLFDETTVVSASSPLISIARSAILSSDTMALWLQADEDTEADEGTEDASGVLTFTTGAVSGVGAILIADAAGPLFEQMSNQEQGTIDNVVLSLESGLLKADASAALVDRSGIALEEWFPFGSDMGSGWAEGIVLSHFAPVADAPTGPSLVTVVGTGSAADVWFDIVPSGDLPYISIFPDVLFLPDRTARLRLTGFNGIVFDDSLHVAPADPAVSVAAIDVDTESNSALVDLTIAGGAGDGSGILYAESGGVDAAAGYRAVQRQYLVPDGEFNQTIYRSAGQGEISIPMLKEFRSTQIAASVFEGIGVRVERVSVSYYGQRIKVVFTMDARGPGGWTGLILSESGHQVVVPLNIVSTDDSGLPDTTLTAALIPSALPRGTRNGTVAVQMPEVLLAATPTVMFNRHMTELRVMDPRVHVTLDDLPVADVAWAQARVDMGHQVEAPAMYPGIPLIYTAGDGAVIGFLRISEEEEPVSQTMEIDGLLDYSFPPDRDVLISADFNTPVFGRDQLVLIRTSEGSPDHANIEAEVLAADGLNRWTSVRNGLLWTWQQDLFQIRASAAGNAFIAAKNMGRDDTIVEGDALCDAPSMWIARMSKAGEVRDYELPGTDGCRLAAVVSARHLTPDVYATPDLTLSLCNGIDSCSVPVDDDLTGDADPVVFFNLDGTADRVRLSARMGSVGYYILNVRGPSVISRVSRQAGNAYVTLDMEPGTLLDECRLSRRHPDTGAVLTNLDLTGVVPTDGRVNVAAAAEPWVTVLDDQSVTAFDSLEDFFVELSCGGERRDAIQVGGTYDPDGDDEGAPVQNGAFDCFSRIGSSIDTNRNSYDVVGGWMCAVSE